MQDFNVSLFFLSLDFYLTAKNVCGHFSKIYNHVVPSHILFDKKYISTPLFKTILHMIFLLCYPFGFIVHVQLLNHSFIDSHMGRLVHYAVFSERHGDGQDWHYFFTEHRFTDIRSLLRHHMTNGLESQSSQNGENRKEISASQSLRESRREQTKLSHVTLKYPRRPQPMKK